MERIRLYRRRWAFLAMLTFLQILSGATFSMFGQISAFFVEYFKVSYAQVDWMTIAINVAPLFTTIPLSWLAFKRILGFRMIGISCAATYVMAFSCFAISMARRSFFAISVVGQAISGVSGQLILTTPSTFAALWFCENEVGTAIAVNGVGMNIGNIFGVLVSVYAINPQPVNATLAEHEQWLKINTSPLIGLYVACAGGTAVVGLLFFIFLTDVPPMPPTIAQWNKQHQERNSIGELNWSSFLAQTKDLLTNRSFVIATLIFGIVFQTPIVEYTLMAQIFKMISVAEHLDLNASTDGAWTIFCIAGANAIATIIAGKLVDKYKRYDRLAIAGTFLVFLSTVVILLGLVTTAYQLLFIGNVLMGLFQPVTLITLYDVFTQQTYPIDETVVTIWLSGIVKPMGVLFGEVGQVLLHKFGPLGVLSFQCANMLFGLILCFLLSPVYQRLNVANQTTSTQDHDCSDESERLLALKSQ